MLHEITRGELRFLFFKFKLLNCSVHLSPLASCSDRAQQSYMYMGEGSPSDFGERLLWHRGGNAEALLSAQVPQFWFPRTCQSHFKEIKLKISYFIRLQNICFLLHKDKCNNIQSWSTPRKTKVCWLKNISRKQFCLFPVSGQIKAFVLLVHQQQQWQKIQHQKMNVWWMKAATELIVSYFFLCWKS